MERTTKALAAAAAQQLPTETIIDTWKANRSDPGGIAAALDAVTAAVRREEEERKVATEAAQAAADQSNVKLPAAAVSEIYATGETHQAGLAAVERTTKALAAAAAQQLPTETIIDTWKANRSDPGGIAAALDAVTAAVRREEEERKAATEAATEADPGDPPPLPSLEERYRERFPTNAGDVDGPRWSPAKELMEEHQALQGLGRRSKLDREYHDCFQRLDSSLFTHHRWPVKDDPSLPHCLLDTHDSPPANEAADPLRAIDQYERSLPTAYGSDWRELDIPGRARKAVEKVVNSVANYFRTEVQEQEAQTAAVREECATDARAFHEAMLEDRRARQLTLDIVDRIHELRYWEREQARREEQADRSPQQSAPQYTPPRDRGDGGLQR